MGAEVGSQLQPPPASRHERLLVLYASQTGTAMDAAERVGREAELRGCSSVVVLSVDAYEPSHLRYEDMVFFIISTTGQGDMPDSMKMFWKFLLQRNLGARWLEGVNCAVFGLGDSSYQKYNFAAKKLDKRLLDIGGTPIIERGFGDDQHLSGYEGTFDSWLASLWKSVHQLRPSTLPSAFEILQPHMRKLGPSKFEVIYLAENDAEKELCSDNDAMETLKIIEKARSMSPGQLTHIDDRPHHLLHVIKNEPLTSGIDKDVRHFELESMTSILEYQLGDVVEVLPGQNAAAIDAFIHRCNLDPASYIIVQRRKMDEVSSAFSMITTHAVKLKTFVELTMDVASASPRRYFFEIMSYFSGSELEREKLQYFASPEGRDDLYQYNQRERRTVLEVLEDFPSVQMPFEWLVQLVPPLKTRAFSISSSPLVHPRELHLTVSVVTWKTPFKRHRRGLCSSWLASLLPNENGEVPVPAWIRRSSLPAPVPSSPLILVGPGTGCAPFRAFIQERSQQSSTMATAPVLFFFGCRNKEGDFLYRDFWSAHSHDSGALSSQKGGGFFVAFSRDQPHKVYVQHKMKEERTRIWRLLCAGGTIYIAGSSNKMPADVTETLEEIISEEGGVSRESASKWLKQQERAGKFYIEAWS